jgi:hypothetical protein
MSAFDILETTLDPVPLFPVEEPDGRKDLSEIERQTLFRRYAATLAPQVVVWANANAGKRNPTQARARGLWRVFSTWPALGTFAPARSPIATLSICYIEFKGYSKDGRPGKLSKAQIEWGNRMHERGHKVACFFSGKSAFDWLASLGAPVRGRAT